MVTKMKGGDRQSFELTVLTILEYLVRHEGFGPVSKYHIMNHVPDLPSQRQDRVSTILELLVRRGWVSTESKDDGVMGYRISESGKTEYRKWVSQFLSFARKLR